MFYNSYSTLNIKLAITLVKHTVTNLGVLKLEKALGIVTVIKVETVYCELFFYAT